jgi:hypothetical protein
MNVTDRETLGKPILQNRSDRCEIYKLAFAYGKNKFFDLR